MNVTPSASMSWLAGSQLSLTLSNEGQAQTLEQLILVLDRLYSELGGQRQVKFQIELL